MHRPCRFLVLFALSVFVAPALQNHVAARAAGATVEATYLGNDARANFNAGETAISPKTAPYMAPRWTSTGWVGIFSQPVAANGLLYWGDWKGWEHATDAASGVDVWKTGIGNEHDNCQGYAGVTSTATVATETINGNPTSVVYVAGGNDTIYALNADTGDIIWSISPDNPAQTDAYFWSSPAVYNGSVYIGEASLSDCPVVQGRLFQLDAATGAVEHVFATAPSGCVGAGISSSPAIDDATGDLYFTTGNPPDSSGAGPACPQPEPLANAIVKLRASDLSYEDSWQLPASQTVSDSDFIATPTLFSATIKGVAHQMVGAANKNGTYYAWDRSSLSAGPIWQTSIAIGGSGPEVGDGSISPSGWDGTTLYVAGGNSTINNVSCKGSVRALNPSTGTPKWQDCLTSGPVLGSVTVVPGVVEVGAGDEILLLDAGSGKTLYTYTAPSTDNFQSTGSIVDGMLFQGDLNTGTLYAFAPDALLVPISPGWNAVSVPLQSSTVRTMSDLIADMQSPTSLGGGSVADGATYVNGRFALYAPGYSADFALSPARGVFVLSRVGGSWLATGAPYPSAQTWSLSAGWNLAAQYYPLEGQTTSAIAAEDNGCDVREIALLQGGAYQVWRPGQANITVPAGSAPWVLCAQPSVAYSTVFYNAFDDQAPGGVDTGADTFQFTHAVAASNLSVQNSVAKSGPNSLAVSLIPGGSTYVYKQYSTGFSTHDLRFNLMLGSDFSLPTSGAYLQLGATYTGASGGAGDAALTLTHNGSLHVDWRDASGGAHILYTGGALAPGSWHSLELYEVGGTSSTSLQVYEDGALVGSASGLNMGSNPVTSFQLGDVYRSDSAATGHVYFDDVMTSAS